MSVFDASSTQCPETSHSRCTENGTWEPPKRCPAQMDPFGDQPVSCHFGPSLIARHNHVRNLWKKHLEHQHWECIPEPKLDDSRERPADVLVRYWSNLRDCAFDWTIVHPLTGTILDSLKHGLSNIDPHNPLTYCSPDLAILNVEVSKRNDHATHCKNNNIDCTPLAADTFGGFGNDALKALKILHDKMSASDKAFPFAQLIQIFQVAVL